MGKFKCCANKSHANFFCIVCCSVFHASCMDRIQQLTKTGENTVICSNDCNSTFERNKTEKTQTILKLEQTLTEVKELRETIMLMEEQSRDKVDDLKNQIINAEELNNKKEKQILELKRRSVSFENDVFQAESNYEETLKTMKKSNSELEKELILLTNKGTEYTSTINSLRNDIEKLESANKNITEENKQCLEEMVLLKSEVNELKYMTVNRKLTGSNDQSINEELQNTEMQLTIDENVSRRMSEVETRLYDKLFRNLKESVLAEIKDKTFPPTSNGKKELIMQTKVNQNQNNRMTHSKEKIVPEHLQANHALSGNIQPQNNCPEIIVTENSLLADQENYLNDIINLDNSASHRRKFNTFAAVVEGNQQLLSACEGQADMATKDSQHAKKQLKSWNTISSRQEPTSQRTRNSPQSQNKDVTKTLKINDNLTSNKKPRLPPIYGSKTGSGHLKAYILVSSIHISKVRLENDDKDIIKYIKTHIPHNAVSCTELKVKSGQYRSFKVGVPANISSQILNSNFWPEHLVVKRFLEPKGNFRLAANNTQRN
ncbi:hypothetical protein WA026_014788 [Henosepilachna vigintioctopunctata]|uniref:Uncharacterized protein n=1 Tax=Henosepilachna vigintioctopunctata TaxID=420089 RepID=A0AAW1UR93_9CUCU